MSNKKTVSGRHTTLDPEAQRSVDWLLLQEDVSKITLGRIYPCQHKFTPGTLRVKSYHNPILTVRAYTGIGIRNIFVHTQHSVRVEQLLEKRWPMGKSKTVMESAFEKVQPTPPPLALGVIGHSNGPLSPLPQFRTPTPVPPAAPAVAAPAAFTLNDAAEVTGVDVRLRQVTPEIAAKWLETVDPKRQRTVKPNVVTSYAADMAAGRWGVSDSVIAFDTDGHLLNGQHRMWAVIEAQTTIKAMVATGYPPDAILYFDAGAGREATAVWRMSHDGEAISKMAMGVARRFAGVGWRGKDAKTRVVPRQELFKFMDAYKDGILWAEELVGGKSRKGIATVAVTSVLTQAYYTVPPIQYPRVKAFIEVLKTGTSPEGLVDNAAVLLRNWTQANPNLNATGHEELYFKTLRALDAFLKREPIKTLYKASSDPFPLPNLVKA